MQKRKSCIAAMIAVFFIFSLLPGFALAADISDSPPNEEAIPTVAAEAQPTEVAEITPEESEENAPDMPEETPPQREPDIIIGTIPTEKSYFEYMDNKGKWRKLVTDMHTIGDDTTAIAYCLQHQKDSPDFAGYIEGDISSIFAADNADTIMQGIEIILSHGYPANTRDFTEEQAFYATANALRAWIYETTGEGYAFMDISGKRIRAREGYEKLYDWTLEMVKNARKGRSLPKPSFALSKDKLKWTRREDGLYRAKVEVFLEGEGFTTYEIGKLPKEIIVEDFTGNSGDNLRILAPTPDDLTISFIGSAKHPTTSAQYYLPLSDVLQAIVVPTVITENVEINVEIPITRKEGEPNPTPVPTEAPTQQPTQAPTQNPTQRPPVATAPSNPIPTQNTNITQPAATSEAPRPQYSKAMAVSITDIMTGNGIPRCEIVVEASNGNILFRGYSADNGQATFDRPEAGSYIFYQSSAAEGYALNTNRFSFTINADGSVNGALCIGNAPEQQAVIAEGEPEYLTITKTDSASGNPIPNVGMEIRSATGIVVFSGYSDDNGIVTMEKPGEGNYTVVDTDLPEGYITPVAPHTFTIDRNGIVNGSLESKTHPTELNVYKTDALNGNIIDDAAATLRLLDDNGEAVKLVSKTDASGNNYYMPYSLGKEGFSTTGGNAIIRYLPIGKYTLEVVKPPKGFGMAQPLSFEITSQHYVGNSVKVTMQDSPLVMQFLSVDSETGDPHVGEVFTIKPLNSDDALRFSYADGSYNLDAESEAVMLHTDDGGYVTVFYLPEGDYVLEKKSEDSNAPILQQVVSLRRNHGADNPLQVEISAEQGAEVVESSGNPLMLIILLVIVAGAGVGIFFYRKKTSNADFMKM